LEADAMTKLCPVCGTENKDEAQFCRSCGGAFPPSAAPRTITALFSLLPSSMSM
jgi:NMD protein affecting ribosome stability and mRNA decay